MKNFLHLFLLSFLVLISNSVLAEKIKSSKNSANLARIAEFVKLVDKEDFQVTFTVVDNGGTTDFDTTQSLFFNIYSKGEMFSTDASFFLGPIFSYQSAKRITGGIYEITVSILGDGYRPENRVLVIDARQAIIDLRNVQCGDQFDCDASTNFEATIDLTLKK